MAQSIVQSVQLCVKGMYTSVMNLNRNTHMCNRLNLKQMNLSRRGIEGWLLSVYD
jgi:hypothetical protein